MKHSVLLAVLLTLCAGSRALSQQDGASARQADDVLMVHLADGGIVWATITGHDETALSIERLDTGGRARMPWTLIDAAQSEELRNRFGYVDQSGDELKIEADRLVLEDGGEVIGKILSRDDTSIVVKTANAVVPVPKARLRGAAGVVQVPALEVYTREELYGQELANLIPGSAQSQFELAQFAERIFDFAHAAEHYKKASSLDPSFKSAELGPMIARAEQKARSQEQLDYLYDVDLLRSRGKFDEALKKAQAFDSLYPDSPLAADAAKRVKQVEKARDQALRGQVVSLWHFHAARLCEIAARDPKGSLETALNYVDEKLGEDVLAAATADLQRRVSQGIEPDVVKKMWAERRNAPAHKASYGFGTWLLGDDARKELDQKNAEKEATPQTQKDVERQKLDEKMKRYLANQAMVQKAKAQGDVENERAVFWSEWGTAGRKQWLLAYFVENGGDFVVRNVLFSNCPDCGGAGVREIINSGSARTSQQNPGRGGGASKSSAGISLVDCPTCKRVGVRRRVVYH